MGAEDEQPEQPETLTVSTAPAATLDAPLIPPRVPSPCAPLDRTWLHQHPLVHTDQPAEVGERDDRVQVQEVGQVL